MSKSASRAALALALLLLTATLELRVYGQATEPDMNLDAAARAAVIDGVLKQLADYYVFPDVAAAMAQALRDRQQRQEYDSIRSAQQLAQTLTGQLQEVSHDKHLVVEYRAAVVPPAPNPPLAPTREQVDQERIQMSERNYGFEHIERLAGNVGYLDLRFFMPPAFMGETAAAAMTMLANADAVIIDLRQNGGGSPDSVALLASYFFPQPVHLSDIYDRPANQTRQFWTLPYVPGRLIETDLYILTSNRTFSAAEDFTYSLKNLKRAVVIGEVTAGGAHPGGPRRINEHFVVNVPAGRSISPVTHTDWEAVGVEPDVRTPAADALARAHLMALEKRGPVSDPFLQSEITAAMERLRSQLNSSK